MHLPSNLAQYSVRASVNLASTAHAQDNHKDAFAHLAHATLITAARRRKDKTPHEALEEFVTEEISTYFATSKTPDWPLIQNKRHTLSSLYWLALNDRANKTEALRSVRFEQSAIESIWLTSMGPNLMLSAALFRRALAIVILAPENEDEYPEYRHRTNAYIAEHLFDVEKDSAIARDYLERRERLRSAKELAAPKLSFDEYKAHVESHAPSKPHTPDVLDELLYQVVNLQLTCDLFLAGNYTAYKAASVILRILLTGTRHDNRPLAHHLPNAKLPQLLEVDFQNDQEHFRLPADLMLLPGMTLKRGSGNRSIVVQGGAMHRWRLGPMFSDKLVPIDDWLSQPFISSESTLRSFIRNVAHKDGGAHYEADHATIRSYQDASSYYWWVMMSIASTVADSLLTQYSEAFPGREGILP